MLARFASIFSGIVQKRGLKDLRVIENKQELFVDPEWSAASKKWINDVLGYENEKEAVEYFLPSGINDGKTTFMEGEIQTNKIKLMKDGKPAYNSYFNDRPGVSDIIFELKRRLVYLKEICPCGDNYANLASLGLFDGLEVKPTKNDDQPTPAPASTSLEENEENNEENKINDKSSFVYFRWVNLDELTQLSGMRKVTKLDHFLVVKLLNKLFNHEDSYKFINFLSQFMFVEPRGFQTFKILPYFNDKQVRAPGYFRTAMADVFVSRGTGVITVNNKPLDEYFTHFIERERMFIPLDVIGDRNLYDVEAHVMRGGIMGKASAIANGIAKALPSFDANYAPILLESGLLNVQESLEDPGYDERKLKYEFNTIPRKRLKELKVKMKSMKRTEVQVPKSYLIHKYHLRKV